MNPIFDTEESIREAIDNNLINTTDEESETDFNLFAAVMDFAVVRGVTPHEVAKYVEVQAQGLDADDPTGKFVPDVAPSDVSEDDLAALLGMFAGA